MEQTIITIIGSLGFPIVVAWFLLTKFNKSIEANTKAIVKLEQTLAEVCKIVYTANPPKMPL